MDGKRVYLLLIGSMILIAIGTSFTLAAQPDHSAVDVITEGEGKDFTVTVILMANDNGTYHIEISETENVTYNFDLLNNGESIAKNLTAGQTFNFTARMRTKSPAIGVKHEVPYEVYQNDVLVSSGTVNIDVKQPPSTGPGGLECTTCTGIIPLILVPGLLIVRKGLIKNRR